MDRHSLENMEAFNVLPWLLTTLFCLCLLDAHVHGSCPIIHNVYIYRSTANGPVTVTTILQSDQVREIFENVSNTILDNQGARFVRFLKLHGISAQPKDCQDVGTMGSTILQSDQVRKIFENVSNTILDNQEAMFVRFLKLHGISAQPKDSQDVGTMGSVILQSDQVREIIENVSNTILDNQEARYVRFLKLHGISAQPIDCQDVGKLGYTTTGVYTSYPMKSLGGFPVRCDMDTDGGGWTVIQRRVNGTTDFYQRTWNQYQVGFGSPAHEYWFGNQQVHLLTAHAWYELRIDMTDRDGNSKSVKYNIFRLADSENGYRLHLDGFNTESEIDDDLSYNSGFMFSTHDRDRDNDPRHCAQVYTGAWWYNGCHLAQLNGKYGAGGWSGLHWNTWTGQSKSKSLARTEMKIRRYISYQ